MIISIDPTITDLGPFQISWHALLMCLGVMAGIGLCFYLIRGTSITKDAVYTTIIWGVILGVVGARIVCVADNLDFYLDHPQKIVHIWEGGLAWYGGLGGATLGLFISSRRESFSFREFSDIAAPCLMLGLAIGRVGCTINGDAFGKPTELPWGITYTHPDSFAPWGVETHPSPIYEILLCVVILIILLRLRRRIYTSGSLFLIMLSLYSAGRFGISFTRGDEAEILGPLHQAHILSIIVFVLAISVLTLKRWMRNPNI
jgi:phosphatidylglycerol:prolipoprotein diacylglycerol transferase